MSSLFVVVVSSSCCCCCCCWICCFCAACPMAANCHDIAPRCVAASAFSLSRVLLSRCWCHYNNLYALVIQECVCICIYSYLSVCLSVCLCVCACAQPSPADAADVQNLALCVAFALGDVALHWTFCLHSLSISLSLSFSISHCLPLLSSHTLPYIYLSFFIACFTGSCSIRPPLRIVSITLWIS